MLRLAARLMREHPALVAIASKTRLDPWEQAVPNVNLLLGTVRGVDGLAAAFSPATGAHQIATAAHEGRRLMAVVLGAPDRAVCARLAAALLRKGFDAGGGAGAGLSADRSQSQARPDIGHSRTASVAADEAMASAVTAAQPHCASASAPTAEPIAMPMNIAVNSTALSRLRAPGSMP